MPGQVGKKTTTVQPALTSEPSTVLSVLSPPPFPTVTTESTVAYMSAIAFQENRSESIVLRLLSVCTWQRQLQERSTDCLHYTVCVGPKNRDKGFSQFTDEHFIHKINDVRNYVWRIGGTKMFTQNKTDWTIIDLHYHVCVFKMSHGDPIKEEQNSFYNKTFFKEERARKRSIFMAIALRVWETFSRYIYSKYAIRQCMQVCCICFSWGAGGGMGS